MPMPIPMSRGLRGGGGGGGGGRAARGGVNFVQLQWRSPTSRGKAGHVHHRDERGDSPGPFTTTPSCSTFQANLGLRFLHQQRTTCTPSPRGQPFVHGVASSSSYAFAQNKRVFHSTRTRWAEEGNENEKEGRKEGMSVWNLWIDIYTCIQLEI